MKYAGPFLPVDQFRSLGLLHETNRLLLHPLGLALSVATGHGAVQLTGPEIVQLAEFADVLKHLAGSAHTSAESDLLVSIVERANTPTERLGPIWDQRDDLGGITYGIDLLSPGHAAAVADDWSSRRADRLGRLGYIVQRAPGGVRQLDTRVS